MFRRLSSTLLPVAAALACATAPAPAGAADSTAAAAAKASAPAARASAPDKLAPRKAAIHKPRNAGCRDERAAIVHARPASRHDIYSARGTTDNPPCDDGTRKPGHQGSQGKQGS